MASNEITVDAGAPALSLTPEEKRVYGLLFRQADTDNVGVVTGEVAVKFFEKTRLDSRTLGEIWQIADKENRGFLTPAGFGIVLRLIGHAQAGREPTPQVALQPGPVPRFDGIVLPPAPTSSPGPAATPIQAQGTGGGPLRIPPLTPEKVSQYAGLFERQSLQAGSLLPGDQAKQIFEKWGLPNEILGRVWQLADTEQRGALVLTEFVIAMHLLQSLKSGALRGLPTVLPAGLYEAATRRGPTAAAPAPGPFAQQLTGQLTGQSGIRQMRTGSPIARAVLAPQTTGDWLISASDKARFDQLFNELDKTNKNFITGEEAVPFFGQASLPEDTLAQIWDLADIRSEGRLNRDEFAVAMYLIRQQRSKKDAPTPLPSTLPARLVPPSMRGPQQPPNMASAFDPPTGLQQAAQPIPPPQQPKSALDDLFGLDSGASPTPPLKPMGTGASNDPFATAASPVAPSSPVRPSPTGNQFKPFVPSSSFGRGLTSQTTGDSTGSSSAFPRPTPQTTGSIATQPTATTDDLLGDHDDSSKKISNDSVELGNLSNQISSLSTQMQSAQTQRSAVQNEVNQVSAQKKNFEQRLSQLRALYEKEIRDVRALEQQLTTLRNDNKKVQMESMALDSTYQDLQNQRQQVLAGLQADQQENASLKERIRVVNGEIAQLKPQIEKLKSEARQQKGLVAINKKQLATNEGERERLKSEAADLTKSNAELARQATIEPPQSAQVASPALSTTSANNPFFRRTASTDIAGTFSPPIAPLHEQSFDDIFGSAAPPSGEPSVPAATFAPQTTGTSVASGGSSSAAANAPFPSVSRQATAATEAPPAPPESRQLSPGDLPLGQAADSLSSSRQVSPPASRMGQIGTLTGEPQAGAVTSPVETTKPAEGIAAAPEGEAALEVKSSEPVVAEDKATSNGNAPESSDATVLKETPSVPGAFPPTADEGSDPFAALDQQKAKDDFDSAFASFKNARSTNNGDASAAADDTSKAFTTFNSEFPPISELHRDDEDDSDTESEKGGGFDDDFTPVSPPKKADQVKAAEQHGVAGLSATAPTGPSVAAAGNGTAASIHPAQSDLSPAESAALATSKTTASHADDIFGTSAPASATTSNQAVSQPHHEATPITQAASSRSAFDELDDDFDGLEDAKEGSAADDDFTTISRSAIDDFNPVFDSSPPASQAAKSESTHAHNNGFGGTTADSSFDFGAASTTSAGTATEAPSQAAAAPEGKAAAGTGESHDWDAIFASLDDGPKQVSPTATAAPPAAANGKKAARPDPPGRALTTGGEHDDPILKSLTGMGYSREDSLSALEKYDYNLDRAANFLASQS